MDSNLTDIIGYLCIFVFFHTIIGTILIAMLIDEIYSISKNKAFFMCFFWSLIILFFIIKFLGLAFMTLFTMPCKKIKQFIKLKETNKIEENKRKKELVNNVLKELKLR
jgi:hypothetical protein